MKLWKKIAISVGVLLVVAPLALVVLYPISDMCGNDVYSEYLSPDKKYKAVIFQRDCGATTGFSTQLSIIKSEELLENESGNVYIIDGHPRDVAPAVSWPASDELIIHRELNGSEYKAESNWGLLNSIKITYGASNS